MKGSSRGCGRAPESRAKLRTGAGQPLKLVPELPAEIFLGKDGKRTLEESRLEPEESPLPDWRVKARAEVATAKW